MINTRALKVGRRKRQERRYKDEQEQVLKRAVKAYKGHGQVLDFDLQSTPAFQLKAVESYVEDLQVLRDDLQERFGDIPEFGRSVRWVDMEIKRALEGIAKLSIQVTKEGR